MADFPFLRECERFPDDFSDGMSEGEFDYDSESDFDPLRACELVGGLEALAAMADGAKQLFKALYRKGKGNVIWLTDTIYVTCKLNSKQYPCDTIYMIEVNNVYDNDPYERIPMILMMIGEQPVPPKADEEKPQASRDASMTATKPSPFAMGAVLDHLLKIVTQDADFKYIDVKVRCSTSEKKETLPASVEALKVLVSEPKRPRVVVFDVHILSLDQWRAILFNCNKNVTLSITFFWKRTASEHLDSLIEAMNLDQSPAKIQLNNVAAAPKDLLQKSLTALEFPTTSLKELGLQELVGGKETLMLLCRAISRNRGLEKLCFYRREEQFDLSDAEWETFCRAIASHPTLQTVRCAGIAMKQSSLSSARDRILIDYVSKNKVLLEFTWEQRLFHKGVKFVKKSIAPAMKFNRFRASLQRAIKRESDLTRQQKLFAYILTRGKVRRLASCRFLFLQQSRHLLAEFLVPMKDKSGGLVPPSSEPLVGKKRKR